MKEKEEDDHDNNNDENVVTLVLKSSIFLRFFTPFIWASLRVNIDPDTISS
jgi:hypothetical protein